MKINIFCIFLQPYLYCQIQEIWNHFKDELNYRKPLTLTEPYRTCMYSIRIQSLCIR